MSLGNVEIRHWRQGDVLIVWISGVLTMESLRRTRAYVARCLAEQDARAVVADLRCAMLALSAEEWIVAVEQTPVVIEPSVALVVSQGCHDMAHDYSRRMLAL